MPDWVQALPELLTKLQHELSMEPGTASDEIWQDAQDASINPELYRKAQVRISKDLCEDEIRFIEKRKAFTKRGLAQYLQIPEEDIHPNDVPVIAMCGSGGGLRALVAGSSSYFSAQNAGLWDCVTYTAGVSGSCWLQLLYNSSLAHQRFDVLLTHLKDRIGTHIAFPPPVLNMLTSAPTNKYLLCGGFEKWKAYKNAEFGLVDVYGLLLGARLLVPKGELDLDLDNLKLSTQQGVIQNGAHPLPIYTAVRHEIPAGEASHQHPEVQKDDHQPVEGATFQWFE